MFILNMEKYLNDEAKICTTNLCEPRGKCSYIALFYSEPITSHFTHLHKYSDSTFLLSHTPMDASAVIWSLAFFPLMLQLEDWRSQPSSTRHFQLRLQTALHTHFQTGFSSIGSAWCPRGRILLKCTCLWLWPRQADSPVVQNPLWGAANQRNFDLKWMINCKSRAA